jgi:hypothetical protein
MAVLQSSAVLTATAGPNSSSWLNGEAGSTSATTVGATEAPSRWPPVSTRAPPAAASAMARSTRSASAVVINEPMVVSGEEGSPVRMASTLGTRASRKSAFTRGMGDHPLDRDADLAGVDVAAGGHALAACSRSASGSTITGQEAPSSSDSFFTPAIG